jgi:3-oxoacyl-[acyl-carrier-protein] synthase II
MDIRPANRVVITGLGLISPLGLDTASSWQGLVNGKSGIGPITRFDASSFASRIAGEVKDFDPGQFLGPKESKRMDRFAQFAVVAAREAISHSGLVVDSSNESAIGTVIGSGIGGIDTCFEQMRTLFERGPDRVSPFIMPMMTTDMAAAQVSLNLGLKGINLSISSACATGTDAIGIAFELIRSGRIPVMLAGGTEAAVNPLAVAGYAALKALSTRNESPETASRPFDATRDGFIISEGAAVLVLEEFNHAAGRGAPILSEIVGYGATADAFHITHPAEDGEGGVKSMQMALLDAGIKATDIGYINAHGTSTPINDRTETKAIKQVFGDYAYRLPVSSTKSMTGHLIGAAGALEASVCALVIRDGIVPPTTNLVHPDPECDLDYVPGKARKTPVKIALSNSFGFGGRNSTIILRAC